MSQGLNLLGLSLAAIRERLDRIEAALGIVGMTPAQADLEAALQALDDDDRT